ncbi:MAG: N-acetylglucosamine-6-phosphate deacetylase, partial [Erysipelotrichaceae bacterium]|nr:N-acetylglucosamine-6-phosphate deacetylase [Erysipelotrichaceae bacterium]
MIIQSKRVWISDRFIEAQLEVENGKIERVLAYGEKPADRDYGNNRIIPGMIDVHTHGAYGFDTNDGEPEGLRNWAKRLPVDEGVTAFQPTTITQSVEVLDNALKNVVNVVEEGYQGAEILGIHFEGPYLDVTKKGAQPEEFILDADVEQFKHYQETAKGLIHYIALAPEHDKDYALTRWCAANGVVVSMGHTNGTFNDARMGIANGAKTMTHVYNGMSAYGHRELGMIGAALRFRDVYGEIITDGIHVNVEAVKVFYEAKHPGYAVMISDSLRPKGLPVGEYTSGG